MEKNNIMDVHVIADLVEERLGTGFRTDVCKAGKNNGQKLLVSVHKDGEKASPAFDVLPALMGGKDADAIADGIVQAYRDTAWDVPEAADFAAALRNKDTGKEYILSHVFCQMAGRQGNARMAAMYPHGEFLDMYVFFRVMVNDEPDSTANVLLTQDMADHFGLTPEILLEAAGKTRHEFRNLSDVLKEMMAPVMLEGGVIEITVGDPEPPLFIIRPENRYLFGADAIMDTEVMQRLSDETGGDLVILPSSVHEILATPVFPGADPSGFREMVASINQEKVSPEDRLTDSVYLYSRDTGEVSILA